MQDIRRYDYAISWIYLMCVVLELIEYLVGAIEECERWTWYMLLQRWLLSIETVGQLKTTERLITSAWVLNCDTLPSVVGVRVVYGAGRWLLAR